MKENQVYYIHGFGSSKESPTVSMLGEGVIPLTYDYKNPYKSLQEIAKKILKSGSFPIIIGSSLGGWYTEQLTTLIPCAVVLYNPATAPQKSLAKYGVEQEILHKYAMYSRIELPVAQRTLVLCMDDEVIDPVSTLTKYKSYTNLIQTSGGHRMTVENAAIIRREVEFIKNQLP